MEGVLRERQQLVVESVTNKALFQDRKRTNLLRNSEQMTISYLVKQMPSFVTPNILTIIGLLGSTLVLAGFIAATYGGSHFLLIGIFGLVVNWFGDSLDGRLAYYRNIPRKWYGFSLDIVMDWIGTVLIGIGYMVYEQGTYEIFAFLFVVLYGWAMIISQLRYKITDQYAIDSGAVGPTEIRVLLSLIILCEVLWPNTLHYFAVAMCAALFIVNIQDTRKLLTLGDLRDGIERERKHKNRQ